MTKIQNGGDDGFKQQICQLHLQNKYQQGYTDPNPTASDSNINLGSACTLRSNFDGATIGVPVFGEFCSGTGEELFESNGCGKLIRQIFLAAC